MSTTIRDELLDFLHELGPRRGLQNELAREAGVSAATISYVATGARSDMMSSKADALRGAMERIRQRHSEGINAPEA